MRFPTGAAMHPMEILMGDDKSHAISHGTHHGKVNACLWKHDASRVIYHRTSYGYYDTSPSTLSLAFSVCRGGTKLLQRSLG